MAAPTPDSESTASAPGACHRRLVRLFEDDERNALMTALRDAANADLAGSEYSEGDRMYLYLEQTPKTSLVSELVDHLHLLGFRIEPNTQEQVGL